MMFCIGCGKVTSWNGQGSCHLCTCGAHVFYNETNKLFLPVCLGRALGGWIVGLNKELELPHLEHLVGTSPDFSSGLKTAFIAFIEGLGGTWAKDCEVCQKQQEVAARLAIEEAERILGKGACDGREDHEHHSNER